MKLIIYALLATIVHARLHQRTLKKKKKKKDMPQSMSMSSTSSNTKRSRSSSRSQKDEVPPGMLQMCQQETIWKDVLINATDLQDYLDQGHLQTTCNNTCEDNNACTVDFYDEEIFRCVHATFDCPDPSEICDSVLGCIRPSNQRECDDVDLCTTDVWDPFKIDPATGSYGDCVYTQVTCVGDQVCLPDQGCTCDDGDICTTDTFNATTEMCEHESCMGGQVCDPGEGCVCDDQDPCTTDVFDQATGVCVFTPCGGGQVCDSGVGCHCDDSNACTVDTWNTSTEVCDFTPAVICTEPNEFCDPFDGKFIYDVVVSSLTLHAIDSSSLFHSSTGECKFVEDIVPCIAGTCISYSVCCI
jgi:hypothetical protein